jgi:hypothetical protein
MYRGSSFLLWKDYKVHAYAVKELLKPQYDSLLDLDMEPETTTNAAISKIVQLRDSLAAIYRDRVQSVNGHRGKVEVTDTLVTKILLGVLACIPAYDTYVVKGMRECGIPYSEVNSRQLSELASFYRQHVHEFKRVRRVIREGRIRYPVMKLVDMYFWEKGADRTRGKKSPNFARQPPVGGVKNLLDTPHRKSLPQDGERGPEGHAE